MKLPKPKIPEGAPAGTKWSGGPIEWTSISLRVMGHELEPSVLNQKLGCQPDIAHRKGDPVLKWDGTVTSRLQRSGMWLLSLKPEETDEWDCGEAMLLLMRRLPSDRELWRSLTQQFKVDFYVSLNMCSWNKGFSLSPAVMSYLGERGIEAGFDILHSKEPRAEQVAAHEPPPAPSSSESLVHGTLDSLPAPGSGGGR